MAYANVRKLLASFDMTMNDIVDEVLYVLDNNTAYAARLKLGQEVYSDPMQVFSIMIGVSGITAGPPGGTIVSST